MLSNTYFVAKFRFDTAENEPAKKLQNFAKFANFADPNPLPPEPSVARSTAAPGGTGAGRRTPSAPRAGPTRDRAQPGLKIRNQEAVEI